MLKILIADGAEEFCQALAHVLQDKYQIRTSREGAQTLEVLRSFSPDVLVLDLMLPGLDGITLLQKAAEANIRPMVLATTRLLSNYITESIDRLGVGYLMVKPCDVHAVAARLEDLTQQMHVSQPVGQDSRSRITGILTELGMPAKLRGFSCAREAVLLLLDKPSQAITKELYPAVARICGGTGNQVERTLRNAIEIAWKNRKEEVWARYLPTNAEGKVYKPTNSSFLTGLANYVGNGKFFTGTP